MKRLTFIFVLAASGLVFHSCTKSNDSMTNATMISWFDTHCGSCHSPGKSDAGKWKWDPSSYSSSITKHQTHLYQVVVQKKSMPPGGMSASELAIFQTWYDAGCPKD